LTNSGAQCYSDADLSRLLRYDICYQREDSDGTQQQSQSRHCAQEKNSEAIQKSACERDDSWSHTIEPDAAEKSRDA